MTKPDPVDSDVFDALMIAELCKPHLKGMGPLVQGAALGELVSLWVAGHAPPLREAALQMHIQLVRQLIPCNAQQLREHIQEMMRKGLH